MRRGDLRTAAQSLLVVLLSTSAPADLFPPPPTSQDTLHVRLDVRFEDTDFAAKRMRAAATHWLRPMQTSAAGSAPAALEHVTFDAVGLRIESVDVAGPRRLPVWSGEGTAPVEWPASEVETASHGLQWRSAPFTADGQSVRIELDPPCPPEQAVFIRVAYVAQDQPLGLHFVIPQGDLARWGPVVYTQGEPIQARYWLPCRDWPDDRWASDVYITLPDPLVAVSVGVPIDWPTPATDAAATPSSRAAPAPAAEATFHWRLHYPVDPHMFGFAVGRFECLAVGGPAPVEGGPDAGPRMPATFAYVQQPYVAAARHSFRRVPEMIRFYEELTGVSFPFEQYNHAAVIRHFHGGMEHAGFSLIAPHLLTTAANGDQLEETAEFNYIAHMLAHEWFAGIVTNRNLGEAWLNEGYATYLHQNWHARSECHDAFVADMARSAEQIATIERRRQQLPLVNEHLTEPGEVYGFAGGSVYWKGAWILHMLRHDLGAEAFRRATKAYLETNRRVGHATTPDLRAAFERASGKDLGGFFGQWVYGSGVPEIQVGYDWDPQRSVARVVVEQESAQVETGEYFQFPLDFHFDGDDGGFRVQVQIDRKKHTFEFPLERAPEAFAVDPDCGLLKALAVRKPPALWRNQVRRGPTAFSRDAAIAWIAADGDASATPLLHAALLDPQEFRGVRQSAARALARLAEPATALDAMLAADRQHALDERLAATIAELLGGFADSQAACAAVLKRAQPGEPVRVRAAAVQSLARFEEDLRTPAVLQAIDAASSPEAGAYVRAAARRARERIEQSAKASP